MFESLYKNEHKINSLGRMHKPPATFQHGKWELVGKIKKSNEDGMDVEVYECRLPARSFKVVAKDGARGFTLSTGSGEEMGELCGLIAKAASEGMIGAE